MTGERTPRGVGFWVGLVAGWAVIGYGVVGLLDNAADTRPADLVRWFVGGAVAHDALVAPVVILAGVALGRAVPAPARAPVAGALIVSGTTALFAWPFLRGYGRIPDNPSALPADYGAGLLAILAAVWAVAAVLAVVAWRRPARSPGPSRSPNPPS